jgi:hypothetical protein
MIDLALKYVVGELNAYFNLRAQSLAQDRVEFAALFEFQEKVNEKANDKIVLSLVNVEEEPVYHSVDIFKRTNGTSQLIKPEVRINLYVLFIANLKPYDEALKALSQVISFFQLRNFFDYSSIPSLADREGRITFDLFSLSFEQQNHLWGALGAKYVPSVMYKVGIVGIRDEQVEAEIPPIRDVRAGE